MAGQITIPIVKSTGGESGRAQAETVSLSLEKARPATLALHADESLQTDNDIAPAIHVSTTFRYPEDPDELNPFYGRQIAVSWTSRLWTHRLDWCLIRTAY